MSHDPVDNNIKKSTIAGHSILGDQNYSAGVL